MTYPRLAERTGLLPTTLAALRSRGSYNTRLSTIEKLCRTLSCQPGKLLELVDDPAIRPGAGGNPC